MIALFLLSAALGVVQTWLTSTVGNQVTGDLRVQLFEHLQAMELGFFTRTKTGVIQSRLQNDVGGVSGVLTNTVTSILGNVVTVIASLVAMILIDWRLTIIAVVMMPFLVIVQRRVGQVRARIAGETQESLSELTAITQETLSVSGILLSKSFNRQRTESARYGDENVNQVRLQVRRAMSGQGFFAVVQVLMASVPAVIYLVSGYLITGGTDAITAGTIVAFTTVQARLLMPLMGLMRVALDLQTSGGAVRAHLRVPRPGARDQRRARRDRRRRRARSDRPHRVPRRGLPLPGCRGRRPPDPPRRLLHRRARAARRVRRAVRRGQDDRALPHAAHVRGIRRRGALRRARTCAA